MKFFTLLSIIRLIFDKWFQIRIVVFDDFEVDFHTGEIQKYKNDPTFVCIEKNYYIKKYKTYRLLRLKSIPENTRSCGIVFRVATFSAVIFLQKRLGRNTTLSPRSALILGPNFVCTNENSNTTYSPTGNSEKLTNGLLQVAAFFNITNASIFILFQNSRNITSK